MKILPCFIALTFLAAPAYAASAQKSTACDHNPNCGEWVESFDEFNKAGLNIYPVPSNAATRCLQWVDGRFVSFIQPDGRLYVTCVLPRWP